MALTYDQLSAITKKYYVPKLVDSIFDTDPWLQRMKKNGQYKTTATGTSAMMPLNYAQVTAAGWFSGADTLSTTDNDVITAAEYSYKQFYTNISISRDDELKNTGDAQVIDLVQSKVKIAESTAADYLGDGIYSSGTNAKSIGGTRVFLVTTGTAGGIDAAANSWWRSQNDTATTTLTISAMQTVYNNCVINNKTPSVVLATRANYNRYYALLQPQQRFTDGDTGKGGFSSVMFNGIPLIAGSKVPSGYLQFIQEDTINFIVFKDEDMRFEPFQKPVNQNVKVAKIYWMGAFGCNNLRMNGVMTAITA